VIVKDIFRVHVVRHKGIRKGETTDVVLRPYIKSGAYRVAKSGTGNTADVEISCKSLDEIAAYIDRGGWLVRMKSAKPVTEGLYAASDIKVVR